MAYYATAMMPLVQRLEASCPETSQKWYADDDAAAGTVRHLHKYWLDIKEEGPKFGYNPNAQKSVLLVKPDHLEEAQELFADTNIVLTCDGSTYLGAAIGTEDFRKDFLRERVDMWKSEISRCTDFSKTQPHAAYSTFIKGIVPKWQYISRAMAGCEEPFGSLDHAIQMLLDTLTGQPHRSADLRSLLTLPAKNGGLAMPVPSTHAERTHNDARQVTEPMVRLAAAEDITNDSIVEGIAEMRSIARAQRVDRMKRHKVTAEALKPTLPPVQQLLIETAGEKGVSSWLTVAPLKAHNTVLNKSDFRDAICIRYGLEMQDLPAVCVCGKDFTLDHAMTCPTGGYPTARHDEVRDVIAAALAEVTTDVKVEPILLPFQGEALPGKTANRSVDARVDIRVNGLCSTALSWRSCEAGFRSHLFDGQLPASVAPDPATGAGIPWYL